MATSDLVGPCVIHNTVCSLLLRESKIYREIEVVNMWWTTIIVVALLAFGIVGFVSMVRLFEQRLTSETTRRAEDMYDQYADSPRERHRRSLTSRRYWPVLPNRVPDSPLRSAARSWRLAFGLALAVRPAGLAGLRGQRRAVGASRAAGCEAPVGPEGQTAGHWGCQARQSPRRRACVRRTRRKLPPRNGETPGEPESLTAGHPWPLIPSRLSAPVLAVHGRGR
jgi:hypothetical protein